MDRSRRLWAVFLTLSVAFFLVERGVSDVSVGQVATTEEPFPTQAIVIDDADTGRYATEGDGWEKNGFPVGYRSSVWMHRSTPASTQSPAARWTFDALPAGAYDVYATWVWGKTLPSSIAYTVTGNAQQLLSASVDQQKTPVGPRWEGSMYPWQKLGTVTLTQQNGTLSVSIGGASTDTFSADAALLLPQQSGPVPSDVAPAPLPSTPVPSAPQDVIDPVLSSEAGEAFGYVCDRGYCKAVLGAETPLAQCQAGCRPEPVAPSVTSSAPAVIALPSSATIQTSSVAAPFTPDLIGYRCEGGICRAAFGADATLEQCQASCVTTTETPPVPTGARWVTVGPPHTSFTSCAQECAVRGGTCMENACGSFQTLWDGQIWTGGQKLKANESLLFHNVCDAQWGNLSPSLENDCCCTGVGADPVCGDEVLQGSEECDDGNGKPGDGCSASCMREFCGDGLVSAVLGEECDPALPATPAHASCGAECTWEYCGDGIIQAPLGETCDDGNRLDGDGCSPACRSL